MSSINCRGQKLNISPDPVIFTTMLLTNWISAWYELTSFICMFNKSNSTVKYSCFTKGEKISLYLKVESENVPLYQLLADKHQSMRQIV